eukprot:XP_004911157.1 PREDICTED: uncharacterized protein LOC101731618 [Xenopus tropicalis]
MQQAVPPRRESPAWQPKQAAQPEPEPGYVEIPIQAEKRVSAITPKVSQSLTDHLPGDHKTKTGDGTDSEHADVSIRKESSPVDRLGQFLDVGENEGEQAEYILSYPSSLAATSNPSSPVCAPQLVCANDEAHYITTHEIQLCEADQEPDYPDFGLAPSTWSEAADSAPCTFLEYASFDSQGGSPTDEDYYMSTTSDPNPTDSVCSAELISSTHSESDTSPSICSSSSNSSTLDKALNTGEAARSKAGILLSIRTASKAINEGSNAQAQPNTAPAGAKHDTDMSYCVSRAPDCKSAFRQHQYQSLPQAADAHRLVAVPARLQARSGVHADISSGASSAVSELDDADKEVRNLTARAFRSLAYPYFEAINFSSSESTTSLSDQNIGINSWSTYLDFKGGALLSQKAEQSIHQHTATSASSFGLRKFANDAPKEQLFVQANKSHTKAFELVVSELETKGSSGGSASCSAKRIQSGSRVVTLTETLNFSSNVTATAPGSDRANKPPEQAPASACTDGVTDPLPRELPGQEGSKQSHSAAEAMEGTHKSKFASSLLKNVISKKMQLEQEFKMERGEITDTSYKRLCTPSKETEGAREKGIQRQNSRFSEASSDFTLVSSEELGEFFDTKSSATPKDLPCTEGNVAKQVSSIDHAKDESAMDPKRSASEAMKGMLLRSQNSAFRSWKEKEIEKMEKKIEEKVAKARRIKIPLERDWKADLGELSGSHSTKMSRLYVPGIQHTPKEKQVEKQATKYSVSTYAHQSCFSRNEHDFKTEKLQVLEAAVCRMTPMLTPKPQEIKLNLPLSGDKENPFSIAKLLTPNLASTAANLSKAAEELKNQLPPSRTEVLEKMPQFLVRDVRENKAKCQGAMHQVRDVRKLLKGSYHLDTGEGSGISGQSTPDPKAKLSVGSKISSSLSPIVITCQAVNNKEDEGDSGDTGEGDKAQSSADTILVHRASGRLPVATIAPNKTGPRMPVVKIVSKASKWKQEKPREQPEVKVEPQSPKSRVALEKLTAAVKTMEQLYVFDRKEWKRKGQPEPLTGSHVLSLISCEEATGKSESQAGDDKPVAPEEIKKATPRPFGRAPEPIVRRNSYPSSDKSPSKPLAPEPRAPIKTFQVSKFGEPKSAEQQEKSHDVTGYNRSVFTVSAPKSRHQSLESALNSKNTRPQPPSSLRIQPRYLEEGKKAEPEPAVAPQPPQPRKASADFENYLTIPVKAASEAAVGKPPVAATVRDTSTSARENAATNCRDPASMCSLPPFSAKSHAASPKSPIKAASDWRSKAKEGVQPNRTHSTGSEPQSPDSIPSATIYHHAIPPVPAAMPSSQAPIFYSPPLTAATPVEMYPQQTQRKMLVDLATGQYYLVDTPVQPVKKRLFDPETGQYVEVPVPAPPATPVPFHMPPLALSPGAYGAAYMFYPGFLPTATTAVLPATPLQSQLSHQGSEHSFEVQGVETSQSGELNMNECPYYLATGSAAANSGTGPASNIRRGSLGCPESKQVISILSQPGPRIVAPPSFDGTTMRFVVEHR